MQCSKYSRTLICPPESFLNFLIKRILRMIFSNGELERRVCGVIAVRKPRRAILVFHKPPIPHANLDISQFLQQLSADLQRSSEQLRRQGLPLADAVGARGLQKPGFGFIQKRRAEKGKNLFELR